MSCFFRKSQRFRSSGLWPGQVLQEWSFPARAASDTPVTSALPGVEEAHLLRSTDFPVGIDQSLWCFGFTMFVSSVWPIFPAHGTQGLVKTACNIFLVKVIESEVNEDTELFSSSKLFSILKNSTKHKIFILLKTFLIFPSKLARERPRIGVCASRGGKKTVWSRQESRGTLCVGGGRGRPLSACRTILEWGIGRLSLPALRKTKMALASCHERTNPFSATVRGGAQGSRLARYQGAAKIVCGATDFAAISLTLEIRPEVAGFEGWLRQVACGPLLLVACSVTGTGQDFAAMPCRRQYVAELLSG